MTQSMKGQHEELEASEVGCWLASGSFKIIYQLACSLHSVSICMCRMLSWVCFNTLKNRRCIAYHGGMYTHVYTYKE